MVQLQLIWEYIEQPLAGVIGYLTWSANILIVKPSLGRAKKTAYKTSVSDVFIDDKLKILAYNWFILKCNPEVVEI